MTDHPDVVIMDLAMPDVDGFEATTRIHQVAPDVAVLVLTMTDDDQTISRPCVLEPGGISSRRHEGGDPSRCHRGRGG